MLHFYFRLYISDRTRGEFILMTTEIVGTLLFLGFGVIITWYQTKYFKWLHQFLIGDLKREEIRLNPNFYYIFWGIATVSVVAGQLYVGSGYRAYANALLRIFDAIEVEVNQPRFY